MKRFIINILAMSLAMTLWTPRIAQAQTGYTWTDISAQLTERQNRPIWAIAYANPYWFFTDGQDLWNGGQVYRFDGTTQVNITLDVRNAGLSRVDDIVSDGQNVLFLKNVVRFDNSFEILKWSGSSYSGLGSYVRNSLTSDEGMSSITGRNGTWMIVTSKGRLFTWNGDKTYPIQISLPSLAQTQVSEMLKNKQFAYDTNHGNFNGLAIVPVGSSDWLLAIKRAADATLYQGTLLYRWNGSAFTDVSGSFASVLGLRQIVSNGSAVVIYDDHVGSESNTVSSGDWFFYDGANATVRAHAYVPNQEAMRMLLSWNGNSWMIIEDKNLYRLAQTGETSLGTVRDYIVTATGDGNGRFLAGGAVSDTGYNTPTSPLTAKLLWVTEGELSTTGNTVTTGGNFGGDRTYTSTNGPRLTVQGDPSGFRVGNGKDFAYRVAASDADGVDRTDLYVNDARIKTCYADTCEYRATYWTNGAATRTVKFWVRSTDKRGYSTDTSNSPDYLTVDVNSTASAGGTVSTSPTTVTTTANPPSNTAVKDQGTGISSWEWLDNNKTTLNSGDAAVYNAGAFDDNGIKRIEIFVNGPLKKTCDFANAKGNQTCSVTLYASDYPQNNNIFVNAKITDGQSKYTWTKGLTLYRSADSGTSGGSGSTQTSGGLPAGQAGKVSAWNWFDPAGELKRGSSTVFRSGAWAENGLSSVEIYVNGQWKKACGFNRAYGNQECSIAVYGNDYAAGTQIAANVKAVDVNGLVTWSDLKYVNVVDANAPAGSSYSGTNNPPAVWDWIEIAKDYITIDDKAKYVTGAWDENGLASVTIYVNGDAKWTCSLGNASGNQACSYEISGVGYSVGAAVFVNAKVTDATGKESWTNGKTFKVMGSGTTTSVDYAKNSSVTAWTDKAIYGAADTMTAYGSGSDPDGVSRMEIYVNGERVKTCTYANQKNVMCEATAGPFPNLDGVTYAVTLFDRYGYEATTGYKSVAIIK